ncbi:MAG: nucleotidyltransferase domain-containing protein [Candidatus Lokiarchaeota archaeon]|nr:nucleotidyltransferase domain-containing protein [Candidatus Lokiarchaeota archaeon]
MVEQPVIEQVKADFGFLADDPRISGIMLFGSHVHGGTTSRSDIDICIIAPGRDPGEIFQKVLRDLEQHNDQYDIWIFEELPLHMQGEIMEHGIPIICKDEPALYEYFYRYRKIWQDVKFRMQFCTG